ncbi:Sec-independent protein translocase subunit TatA/TatB [Nitrosophilus kaiyonis]|uniref:Sec-independent protein translocase subunit TatA/TatB n=1 Tax=Nitrosophilus kaiyonis TaxID=2930200 RepID=UPI002491FE48|nr:twin-arginine translocase TatA/TatE family subunit [Nitrosophilus kaiyonis]
MGMPSMPELLVILAIVVLLFGAKKIPELAKGLGSGIKNFKKAMKEDEEETTTAKTETKKEIEGTEQTSETSQTSQKKEA